VDLRGEKDIEHLRRIALVQQTQIQHLMKVLAAQSKELESLKGNPEELQQTLALLEALTKKAEAEASAVRPEGPPTSTADSGERPKPRAKTGPTEQPKLPVAPALFELPPTECACPSCGGELKPMVGQSEDSEMIDVVEVSYRLVHVQRQKYVCRCGGAVVTARGPDRAAPGSRYSLAFAMKVALDKYLDHLPLARQERILRRHGVEITTQTLFGLIDAPAKRLQLPSDALLRHALSSGVIGLDQTSWMRLDDRDKNPWQMWCITAPGVVAHRIRADKSADTFRELLEGYRGTIVCDAAKTHEAGVRGNDHLLLAGCWAHAFRKFEEASADHPTAAVALDLIGKLYEVDARAGDDLALRAELRRTESTEILATLRTWLWAQAPLKSLSIGKASGYVIANWDRLTRFTTDARIPLDNNATERAIRGPVVGRRNHFGSKSERGTRVAATYYTLIETAKLHGVDPATYLVEAARAADRGVALLPWELTR